jgi:hypothetical protein
MHGRADAVPEDTALAEHPAAAAAPAPPDHLAVDESYWCVAAIIRGEHPFLSV